MSMTESKVGKFTIHPAYLVEEALIRDVAAQGF